MIHNVFGAVNSFHGLLIFILEVNCANNIPPLNFPTPLLTPPYEN